MKTFKEKQSVIGASVGFTMDFPMSTKFIGLDLESVLKEAIKPSGFSASRLRVNVKKTKNDEAKRVSFTVTIEDNWVVDYKETKEEALQGLEYLMAKKGERLISAVTSYMWKKNSNSLQYMQQHGREFKLSVKPIKG